jgi:RNA polymerase sigma-70 factor (ECF subfamily)
MNHFLAGVEKRAFAMARMAVKNPDDALDIVQNSMLMLVRKYAHKSADDWAPLFYRILQNGISDCHRSRTRQKKLFVPGRMKNADGEEFDAIDRHAGPESDEPEHRNSLDAAGDKLRDSLAELPGRQQQAFLLRAWEGLSVADAARSMRCSEGSVKTHYSRAVHRLRELLGDNWS